MRKITFLLPLALAITGCTSVIQHHGQVLPKDSISHLKRGKTKTQIVEIFGEPCCVFNHDPQTWYYLSQRLCARGIFFKSVKENTCIVLRFSPKDTLIDYSIATKAVPISPAKAATPLSSYYRKSFIESIFSGVNTMVLPV